MASGTQPVPWSMPRTASAGPSTANVAAVARCANEGDSPLMNRTNMGNTLKKSSPTTIRNSTGARSNASFTSGWLNRPPETSCPRALSSQNRTPPIARSPKSR